MSNFSKLILAAVTTLFVATVQGQCPQITCPSNISVNNDAGNCSAVVTYTAPVGTDPCSSGSTTFNFTGGMQTFTVPAGVTSVTIQAYGAQGGSNAGGVTGGLGGYATGTLAVTPGDVLNVYVGGTSGYNGGGTRGNQPCATAVAGNGGGASDVRLNGTALTNRVIVAGGGGGAGGNRVAGCGRGSGGGGGGGYYGGGGGAAWPFASTTLPTGGTQAAGGIGGTSTYTGAGGCNNGTAGSLGQGGNGGCEVSSSQGGSCTALAGGVGGGTTGGNGQYSCNWTGQSGAGGSSYITGLTGASTTSGSRTGNGQVIISYTGATITTTQIAGLASGSTFPVGTTTNTFQATNIFGTVTCSFTVTVVDAENPVITCPGATTINTDAGLCTSTASIGTATATDNCTATPTITNDAPASFPIGNTTVTWTATDASGNFATCTQVVTVVDAENPVITCPGAITINTDAGLCTSTAAIGTATATDNCTATPTITNDAPASFPIGNTTVTWTATDAS
ncbi:MAG: HYR domain-containing protein, partial [Flavobacteriales bacterium]|nr:HYR domain-containing protein [Flavobacteriales bacterium]